MLKIKMNKFEFSPKDICIYHSTYYANKDDYNEEDLCVFQLQQALWLQKMILEYPYLKIVEVDDVKD